MTTPLNTPTKKWIAVATCALWILAAGWIQIFGFGGADTYRSPRDAVSPAASCRKKLSGSSFARRYDCTSSAMLSDNRRMFVNGTKRFIIVLGPPFFLFMGFRWMGRRNERLESDALARRKSIERRKAIEAREKARMNQAADALRARNANQPMARRRN